MHTFTNRDIFSVHNCICTYIHLHIQNHSHSYGHSHRYIHLSIHLSIHPSIYLSVHLSICPSICLSVYLSIYLISSYLSICLSFEHLSIYLRVYASTAAFSHKIKLGSFKEGASSRRDPEVPGCPLRAGACGRSNTACTPGLRNTGYG